MRLTNALLYLFLAVALSAAPAAAEIHNEFGLYTDLASTPDLASIQVEPLTMFDVYLTVTNPYNYEVYDDPDSEPYERAISLIEGFGVTIEESDAGLQLMEAAPNSEDFNTVGNAPSYHIGFVEPVPVPENGIALLMTLTYMSMDSGPHEIYFGPEDFYEKMWIDDHRFDYWGSLCDAYPSSNDLSLPVFGVNKTVVATDTDSWDGVKALFR